MRILQLIKSLGRGGAEMLLPETLKLHDSTKFEFHCIYFLPWKNQLVTALEGGGATVTCFSASNNISILRKIGSLKKYVRDNQIDMVHCHLPWAGFLGRILFQQTGVPVIYTEHNKQERYHFITRLINRTTFNFQSMAVAVSRDVRDSILSNIHPRVPVKTILNGVNTNHFKRNKQKGLEIRNQLGIPADAIVVGTIAVFRFQKRLLEWIEVASRLSKQNREIRFIIVGDGPLKLELQERVKELQLENCLWMPGLQEDVVPWLSAMDIYMMSSVFEGLPIALLEAMSMECAIVTTNAGGIKEVIRHEQDGRMVDVENWEQLEHNVNYLIGQPQSRQSLSVAARSRVEDAFSLQRMVKELEELYQSIILPVK